MEGLTSVSGAQGRKLASAVMKYLSPGTAGNSTVSTPGGGLGGLILGMLCIATGDDSMDISGITESVAAGGVSGGILLTVVGVVKNTLCK